MRCRCCCCCDCTSAMKRAFTTKPAGVDACSASAVAPARPGHGGCAAGNARRHGGAGRAPAGWPLEVTAMTLRGGGRAREASIKRVGRRRDLRNSRCAARASAHTCWRGAETPSAARRRTCLRRACRRKSAQRPSPTTGGGVSSARAAQYSCAAMPRLARCRRCARASERRTAWRGAGVAAAAVPKARNAALSCALPSAVARRKPSPTRSGPVAVLAESGRRRFLGGRSAGAGAVAPP